MAAVATPIVTPYFVTGAPVPTGSRAILCPSGMSWVALARTLELSSSTTPSTVSPALDLLGGYSHAVTQCVNEEFGTHVFGFLRGDDGGRRDFEADLTAVRASTHPGRLVCGRPLSAAASHPSRHDNSRAARPTIAASSGTRAFVSRVSGPEIPSAAITRPGPSKTGAATAPMSSRRSPRLNDTWAARMVCSSRASSRTPVMVRRVNFERCAAASSARTSSRRTRATPCRTRYSRRHPAAYLDVDAQGLMPFNLRDPDDVEPVENRDVRSLARLADDTSEHVAREGRQIRPSHRRGADLPQLQRERVLPRWCILSDVSPIFERAEKPVNDRLRQMQPPCDFRNAQQAAALQGFKHIERVIDGSRPVLERHQRRSDYRNARSD